jgi:transcriptional regulator with XRE-family HTH domain
VSDIRFGSALRVLRTARGISLRGLARELNVSPAYLSQVENGKLPAPSHERIEELSRSLEIPAHRLFALAAKVPPNVTGLLERTPEAARFLMRAAELGLPGLSFHQLTAALERHGVDATAELIAQLADAAPGDATPQEPPQVGGGSPLIYPYLREDLVFADLKLEAWADIIDLLAEAIAERAPEVCADDVATPLTEDAYPSCVCIGGGFAIPHLGIPGLARPVLAFGRLARPLVTASEGDLRYVFLLLYDRDDPEGRLCHLARLAQICANHNARLAMERGEDTHALYHSLLACDSMIR